MQAFFKRTLSLTVASVISIAILTSCGGKDTPSAGDSTTAAGNVGGSSAVTPSYINSEWQYGQVAMGGGGFVTGVFATPEKDLYYARTDVGGAYRWDKDKDMWVSLSYAVSEEDRGLLGIEGLAVDPNAANKVYLLAGTSYFSDGKTAVLRSEDYGKTFETIVVTDLITVSGNGMGRQNGEKIAVDPNNSDILFAGGRTGGLIKSTDGGRTWAKVEAFPAAITSTGVGINGIVFDGASKRIYVTVSEKGESVFFSDDGGDSWSPVAGLPQELFPQRARLDSNGSLVITYGGAEGPWNGSGGGIFRLNKDGSVEDISPDYLNFGDVAIDPNNPDRMVACTENVWVQQPNSAYGDNFFVTTDGGDNWNSVLKTMVMDNGGVEWVTGYAIHWCGCMMIDPFNTDTIMVISGNGIFRCDNIWDSAPKFSFFARGIEETVPLDCVSVKGGNLVSAIGDYDGFDHSDVTRYGRLHTAAIGTTTGVAVAGQNHDVWAKVGGDEKGQKILYSEDGGDSWKSITNRPDSGKNCYKGSVALTADGKTIIWSPENALYSYYTEDRGATWNKCSGGARGGCHIMGDSVNPDYVYACGGGKFCVSSDGGKTFTTTLETLGSYNRIIVAADKEGEVYVPGSGYGLFVSKDHGQNFTRIDTVRVCNAVGLGKGKTDSDPYVIYIWGQPAEGDVEGIYMSEDEGKSWSRVNDDLHQFGGIGNGKFVVGDFNIYGRCYMSTVGLGLVYCDKIDKN